MEEKKHFDITPLMVPYFDVHLIIPLFDFLKEVMPSNDVHLDLY